MVGNAFKTEIGWWNLYTFSNKKRREKKIFSIKRMTLLDNGSLALCRTSAADARTKEKKEEQLVHFRCCKFTVEYKIMVLSQPLNLSSQQ